jgi:hypothetical protein
MTAQVDENAQAPEPKPENLSKLTKAQLIKRLEVESSSRRLFEQKLGQLMLHTEVEQKKLALSESKVSEFKEITLQSIALLSASVTGLERK